LTHVKNRIKAQEEDS